MNAVEIEEAVSQLVTEPFDRGEFPYQFLAAYGFGETTLKKLRTEAARSGAGAGVGAGAGPGGKKGAGTDVEGAVLLRNQIHMLVCDRDDTGRALTLLRESTQTTKARAKFIAATDGVFFEAEEVDGGNAVSCPLTELPSQFTFFFPLAGISTVAEIRNNPIDIKATARLNKLYVELLKDNPAWAQAEKRPALNQFMARLIFCFFAEDTGIFLTEGMFSKCVRDMSDSQSTNTHEVIAELFRAMNTPNDARDAAKVKSWANTLPYVNGGLYSNDDAGKLESPIFSKIARSYLLRCGELDWKQINPDIFGSMIQAVADDDERGSLGMHYTSVPNILKVLDPLFLDDVREQLTQAGDNARKLLNLRKRIAKIRVFDPACGSGNFLVIAYLKLREIEHQICELRKDSEKDRKTWVRLTNFYGIEIKSFPAEIARLALLIAEFQSNVRYIGQREACRDVLPLHNTGHIVCGNALRLDWLEVCPPPPPKGSVRPPSEAGDEPEPGVETYICGNPPYKGNAMQTDEQKADLEPIFRCRTPKWKSLDYVAGWFQKAADVSRSYDAASAFVSTNSLCQGQQVAILWPLLFETGAKISFAHTSFKWSNLASHVAGVTVAVVGLAQSPLKPKLYSEEEHGMVSVRDVENISGYLVPGSVIVEKRDSTLSSTIQMERGSAPVDGGNLLLTRTEVEQMALTPPQRKQFVRSIAGSAEFIRGIERYCLWIKDSDLKDALRCQPILERIAKVREMRLSSRKLATQRAAATAHAFDEIKQCGTERVVIVPKVSSEAREYLPVGLLPEASFITDLAFGLYDAPLWNMALIASKLHLVWIATVCGKLETRIRYSNTLGWNTFPVPPLMENDKAALTRCAEDILLAREAHFPATIADLYDPERMPANLRAAHDRNDETLERIYIGRRFKNDTERLEKLFDMYTKMVKAEAAQKEATKDKARNTAGGDGGKMVKRKTKGEKAQV